jgi:hypothetical protein
MAYPRIEEFVDYHEIYAKLDRINARRRGQKLRAVELDPENFGLYFDDAYAGSMVYYALFYTGRKPATATIKARLVARLKRTGMYGTA